MRRWRVLVGVVIMVVWAAGVNAESKDVIYRKSDRLVVGYVTPPHSVDVELENITKSQLGGVKSDYAVVTLTDLPRGHRPVINLDGTVTTEEYPELTKQRADRSSAKTKLQGLGLTADEITALLR